MFSFVFEITMNVLNGGASYQRKLERYHIYSYADGAFTCRRFSNISFNTNAIFSASHEAFFCSLIGFYDEFYGVRNALNWLNWYSIDRTVPLQSPRYDLMKLSVSRYLERAMLGIQDMFFLNVQLTLSECHLHSSGNNIAKQIYSELMEEYEVMHQQYLENRLKVRISTLYVLRKRMTLDRYTMKFIFKKVMDHVYH